jgi:uncharacterized protein YndB with AHSA1/START domain
MSTTGSTSNSPNAVYKTITVRCDVATAFRVWTEQINLWWPKSHSRSRDPNTTVMLEARAGGRLYERTSQGVEHDWGEVTAWEPPHHFAFNWYLGSGPAQPTHVDVRFANQGAENTRVEVTHRGPELIGELRSRNQSIYDASWQTVLMAYSEFTYSGFTKETGK